VASKRRSPSIIEHEFDRAFNEVFEDLLIKRWRGPAGARRLGKALVLEDEDTYRVKVALPGADPDKLEVEAGEWRLTVRALIGGGQDESTFDFSRRIDTERVTARFEAGILEVTVPKARGRKIEVD
jgi:HSP20 family molecular chaperone IbpA